MHCLREMSVLLEGDVLLLPTGSQYLLPVSTCCNLYTRYTHSIRHASRTNELCNMLIIMQKRMVALQPCSMLFSGFLRSAAFLPQAVHSQTICFRHSRRTPSPTLLCTGAMPSGQLFSIRIVRRLTLRVLRIYKRWISLW